MNLGGPEGDHVTDEELVRRVGEGDEAALSALYRRYVAAIYRFVLAQVRDVQDAEDLCSETFARMLRGLEGFRGEASFKNWLYQIARNAVRNHRRASGYRRLVPLSPTLKAPEEPGAVPKASDETLETVLRILQPLPPRYRRVLELRFLQGHTVEETAAAMGITVANAKVLQHRALKKAAAGLEEAQVATRRARR
jgi:RNA polymerase sigma-70 factor (ECF subfamily)